ncbi:MAG: hypothetical protein ACYCTE_17585 [Acidimicrobiales bacterium]
MEITQLDLGGKRFEMVRVDTLDYDGLCEIVAWCGGVAVDEGDAWLAVDVAGSRVLVGGRDVIVKSDSGEVSVIAGGLLDPVGWPVLGPPDSDETALAERRVAVLERIVQTFGEQLGWHGALALLADDDEALDVLETERFGLARVPRGA